MTFIDITCMSDRSEEVIIETFPRRNDTPFFTTRSCRLKSSGPTWFVCSIVISTHAIGLHCYCYALLHMNIIISTFHSHSTLLHFMHLQEAMHCEHCLEGSQLSCIANNATRIYATCTTMIVRCVYVRMHECTMHKLSHLAYMYM